jgi:hypothetical protein
MNKAMLRLSYGMALALALLVAAHGVARAEDDDDAFDKKIFRSFLEGLGLRDRDVGIDYRERSPLVIPPSRDLPSPQNDAVAVANPAWPKDPDAARALAAKKSKGQILSWEEFARPLTPAELNKGRTRGRKAEAPGSSQNTGLVERLMPSELGYKGGLFGSVFGSKKEDIVQFKGEPPRAALTEPPVGYRTPSPNQPYGALAEKYKADKPQNSYITRVESQN